MPARGSSLPGPCSALLLAACFACSSAEPRAVASPDAPNAAASLDGSRADGSLASDVWDWAGIIGTGQSLAVGDPGAARGTPAGTPRATQQPYANLMLSTGALSWPIAPDDPALTVVPLVEPIGRRAPGYPSAWPENIAGETPHAAMAAQISASALAFGSEHVSVHTEVGENGQCLSRLIESAAQSGVNGRAYAASLIEARALTRLARVAGRRYGVGAITLTHGECDAGNLDYEQQLHELWRSYARDLPAITGQRRPPLLILSQQNAINDRAASTLAQWRIGADHPRDAVCAGPKYQYTYSSDAVHLVVDGYERLGEKYGQVYHQRVVLGRDWQPLQPIAVQREGRVVSVRFHVPVPPLAWEDSFQLPHQQGHVEWNRGRGFELWSGDSPLAIADVRIEGDSVRISAKELLPPTVRVAYALTANPSPMATPFAGTTRWGLLRDSDPLLGVTTGTIQPNFALAFELPVPSLE